MLKRMRYNNQNSREISGVVLPLAVIAGTAGCCYYYREIEGAAKCFGGIARKLITCISQPHYDDKNPPTAYEELIGNTPLIKLHHLSKFLRRSVYVKMESMNPGGTGKDRAALSIIQHAEETGLLPPPSTSIFLNTSTNTSTKNNDDKVNSAITATSSDLTETFNNQEFVSIHSPLDEQLVKLIREAISKRSRTGGLVVEGTSGSTGIALATLCAARGHACLVVMPDDQAVEKQSLLKALGAIVHVVPNAAISNPNHYVNIACKAAILARERLGIQAVFGNQFENYANYDIHYRQTGPELWNQCPQLDAFCMSSGTGGTISGVGSFLKEKKQNCKIVVSIRQLRDVSIDLRCP